MSEIKVSVVIPVYKTEKYIVSCAKSLFSQTMREMEFIFVDDASPDDSIRKLKEVVGEFPERENQVKIIHHEINAGPLASRKQVIAAAKGEYVAFCDSDDYVEPDMYETMYRKAEQTSAEIIHCGLTIHHAGSETGEKRDAVPTTDYRTFVLMENRGTVNPFPVTHMFRRDVLALDKLHLPDSVRYTEDMLMIFQIFRHCGSAAFVPDCKYHYIRNSDSICHGNTVKNMRQNFYVLHYLDKTETDREILEARKTRWRNFVYSIWRDRRLSPMKIRAMLRYCGKGAVFDANLKRKKRIRLFFLWLKSLL